MAGGQENRRHKAGGFFNSTSCATANLLFCFEGDANPRPHQPNLAHELGQRGLFWIIRQQTLGGKQVFNAFSRTRQMDRVAIHQDFRRTGTRIVV